MHNYLDHDQLEAALERCGSTWNAGMSHGLLCSRLAVLGTEAEQSWLQTVLQDTGSHSERQVCATLLEELFVTTYQQLSGRRSDFQLLLPDDASPAEVRTAAMARWCEGYLHGLVSETVGDELRNRLAAEPLCDIIRDMLQITRATVDAGADEDDEEAYTELVEYLRIAAQLAYEELAELRASDDNRSPANEDFLH